ncbi:MAG: hypothetical protein ACOVQK_02200 [Cyanobium sp.]
MPEDAELFESGGLFDDVATPDDIRKESSTKEWAAGARYSYWVGVVLLGSFLTGLINAAPPRLIDPAWQLNLIGLLLGSGGIALIGALLIFLARIFDQNDRQLQKRAQLVRTLATWVALGWLLLIPLQLFLGFRLINSQGSSELGQIEAIERVAKAVRDANSEFELRKAMALVPNQAPPPPPHRPNSKKRSIRLRTTRTWEAPTGCRPGSKKRSAILSRACFSVWAF